MSSGFNFSNITGFEWDKGNLGYIKKHNVSKEECEEAFFNKPLIINKDKAHSKIEDRYRAYGKTNRERLLTMVFTIRNNRFRILSARSQSKKERREFNALGGENT